MSEVLIEQLVTTGKLSADDARHSICFFAPSVEGMVRRYRAAAVRAVPVERLGEGSGMTATTRRPYSVLITDDDPRQRETLRDIVEPEGFRTLLASSGEEALEIVRHEPVHVVLLDMHMPTLTGLETVQLVHQQVSITLPCILVTADANDALIRRALQAHVYSVIPKPVSKHVVLYTVVRAIVRAYGRPDNTDPKVTDRTKENES